MAENEPRAKGGQGTISIGSIIPPEELPRWVSEEFLQKVLELKLAIKKFEWDRADVEKSAKCFKVEFLSNATQVAVLTSRLSTSSV